MSLSDTHKKGSPTFLSTSIAEDDFEDPRRRWAGPGQAADTQGGIDFFVHPLGSFFSPRISRFHHVVVVVVVCVLSPLKCFWDYVKRGRRVCFVAVTTVRDVGAARWHNQLINRLITPTHLEGKLNGLQISRGQWLPGGRAALAQLPPIITATTTRCGLGQEWVILVLGREMNSRTGFVIISQHAQKDFLRR